MTTIGSRAPFVRRSWAYIGDPVGAKHVPNHARRAIVSLKDFRGGNLVAAHTGYPAVDISLPANRQARWHLCLPGAARPDVSEDRRRYAIQLLPWVLQTGPGIGTQPRSIEWVEDAAVPTPDLTVQSGDLYTTADTTTPATSGINPAGLEVFGKLQDGSDIIGAAAQPASFRHALIKTSWWWPAHLGVYEIPFDSTTAAQQIVTGGATITGAVARGWQAGNADRSWGSLADMAGRVEDGPLPGGRRCLFSWMHGVGAWLTPAPLITSTHGLFPRVLAVPGATSAPARPAWVITCTTADMTLRWECAATGEQSEYTTTGLEAETMVMGPAFEVGPLPDAVVTHNVGTDPGAAGTVVIHASYLFDAVA